jgi:hypothetical protein
MNYHHPKSILNSRWLISACLVGAAAAGSIFAPTSASAAQDCAGLANLKIDNTNLLSATEVAAGGDFAGLLHPNHLAAARPSAPEWLPWILCGLACLCAYRSLAFSACPSAVLVTP